MKGSGVRFVKCGLGSAALLLCATGAQAQEGLAGVAAGTGMAATLGGVGTNIAATGAARNAANAGMPGMMGDGSGGMGGAPMMPGMSGMGGGAPAAPAMPDRWGWQNRRRISARTAGGRRRTFLASAFRARSVAAWRAPKSPKRAAGRA